MSIATLNTRIKQNDLGGVFLFYGEEDFLIRQFLTQILERVIVPGTEQMNYIRIDDSKDLEQIIEAVETYPIFAERKLVVVTNTGFFGVSNREAKTSKSKDDIKTRLVDFLKDIPDYCCLVFVEESVAKNTKAYKTLAASGLAVKFARLKENDLAKWIAREFSREGKRISVSAVNRLISMCSNSLNEIHNEVLKICNLVGERAEVNEEDVASIASSTIKTAIFEITNALANRDSNRGLTVLDNLLQLNEPVQRLFIMVCKRFGQFLILKELLEEGVNQDDAVLKAGFGLNQKRFVLREVAPFSKEYLRDFVRECHRLDLDIKKGRLTDRMAMEILIAGFSRNK